MLSLVWKCNTSGLNFESGSSFVLISSKRVWECKQSRPLLVRYGSVSRAGYTSSPVWVCKQNGLHF